MFRGQLFAYVMITISRLIDSPAGHSAKLMPELIVASWLCASSQYYTLFTSLLVRLIAQSCFCIWAVFVHCSPPLAEIVNRQLFLKNLHSFSYTDLSFLSPGSLAHFPVFAEFTVMSALLCSREPIRLPHDLNWKLAAHQMAQAHPHSLQSRLISETRLNASSTLMICWLCKLVLLFAAIFGSIGLPTSPCAQHQQLGD